MCYDLCGGTMNRKMLENFCILLIITIFVIIGYYTYKSYENKRDLNDSTVEINNFYNVDYLFNNSYIDTPKTIEDFSSKIGKIYMYLDADNTMYIKYPDNEKYNKKITGLPKESVTVYYNNLYDNYYEFLGKTDDGDIYYSFVDLSATKDEKYTLISNNINKIYIPFYDKSGVYVNQKDIFATNYILYDNEENLKYIDMNHSKKYILKSNIDSKKPYFDYICASNNSFICSKLMIYITFNNELVYNNEYLKNSSGKKIYVKDIFSSFEIISDKDINIDKITKKELQQYDYLFQSYIIDNNQIVYKFDVSNKDKKLIALNNESNKVKEYIYEPDEKLIIIFEDGTSKLIKVDTNKVVTTSTIYDKNQNNEEKILLQP